MRARAFQSGALQGSALCGRGKNVLAYFAPTLLTKKNVFNIDTWSFPLTEEPVENDALVLHFYDQSLNLYSV
jgi:hypothetical protein